MRNFLHLSGSKDPFMLMQSRVLNEAKDPRDHVAISDPGREFSRDREAISVVS